MSELKNIAVAGASGDLGTPVVAALLKTGKFNITALSRNGSKSTFPASVKVAHVDFESIESLTAALKGQDAVVSTVGTDAFASQPILVEAAVAAGVKRFIPSEFGSDTLHPKTGALPIFGYKVAVFKLLKEKAAANPSFTYTTVHNGPFLDWGLNNGFLINRNPTRIFNGGNTLLSTTTLASVGEAVASILSKPAATANKSLYIQDIAITQNRLVELAKKAAPDSKWEIVDVNVDELLQETFAKLQKGDFSTFTDFLIPGIFAEGYGGYFEKNDNELLGLKGKTEADVEAIWKTVLSKA